MVNIIVLSLQLNIQRVNENLASAFGTHFINMFAEFEVVGHNDSQCL